MPTAARLTAAIMFGALSLAFAYMASPYFPEAREPYYWYPLCGALGVVCGWVISGTRAGRGYVAGVGNGITSTIAIIFWIYFLMSFADMIKKSLRKSYDGPIEALINVFQIMLDWLALFAVPQLGILLAAGALVGGLVTEFVGRRLT